MSIAARLTAQWGRADTANTTDTKEIADDGDAADDADTDGDEGDAAIPAAADAVVDAARIRGSRPDHRA